MIIMGRSTLAPRNCNHLAKRESFALVDVNLLCFLVKPEYVIICLIHEFFEETVVKSVWPINTYFYEKKGK